MKIRGVARVKNPGGQVVMWHVVACRRRPAAPSDLPKSGGAAAPPAPALGASLYKDYYIYIYIVVLGLYFIHI